MTKKQSTPETFEKMLEEIESVKNENMFLKAYIEHIKAILMDHADALTQTGNEIPTGDFKDGFMAAINLLRYYSDPPNDVLPETEKEGKPN